MKKGKSLSELATEIERRSATKQDFVADSRQLKMVPASGNYDEWKGVHLQVDGHGDFSMLPSAHSQLSSHTKIPKKYYDMLLKEAPALLSLNVNHWMDEKPKRRMVRTLDGNARAFLSDRYRILDNDEVLESVLPVLSEMNQIEIKSCDVTDRKLYLKCTFPDIRSEVEIRGQKVGDLVEAGFMLTNSEIGQGSVNVQPLMYRLSCLNGMVMADHSLKKYHVGRTMGQGCDAIEFFKDDTLRADDKAFLLKLRDVVKGAADEVTFKALVDRFTNSTYNTIDGDVVQSVEVVQKKFGFNDNEKHSVLKHLIEGGELSQWGIANAVTRASQDVDDYDMASDMERAGGKIIELNPSEWKEIGQAKAA